jgi:hypothetical protein
MSTINKEFLRARFACISNMHHSSKCNDKIREREREIDRQRERERERKRERES